MSAQSYITPEEVADLVTSKPKRNDYLIIDVRSSDFPGGNLPGALNLTTDKFSSPSKIDSVITRYITPRNPSLLIVHCMRSQTRGPYVAHLLSKSSSLPPDVEVKVLKGGFQGWYRQFRGRKELFENLEEGQDDQDWEDFVNADEGDKREAEDSRKLREEQDRRVG